MVRILTHSGELSEYLDTHPWFASVAVYQTQGFRTGASFLFGWVQGAFGVDWSYLVYPGGRASPDGCWRLGIGRHGFLRRAQRPSGLSAPGAALITTFNGFSFGAFNGFLPQTYGEDLRVWKSGLIGMYMACLQRGETYALVGCFLVHCSWPLHFFAIRSLRHFLRWQQRYT